MDTPTLQNRIRELQAQVAPYAKGKKFTLDYAPFSFDTILTSNKIYIAIPVIIFFLLLFFRPTFIEEEKPDKKGNVNRYLSFKKLLQFWLIISTVLLVGFYTYNYKMKKD